MSLRFSHSTRWIAVTGAGALIASTLLVASPAQGATFDGGDNLASLNDAIRDAELTLGPDTIALTPYSTIVGGGGEVVLREDLTIELSGSTVENLRIRISTETSVTLRGGTWTALPSANEGAVAPGFGVPASSSLTLDAMTVTATGSECDSGIGGWFDNRDSPLQCDIGFTVPSGAITITNSLVEATGGINSAGIGGGSRSDQGPITITDSTVSASGGPQGPGIGGGKDRPGGVVTITNSAVTATGGGRGAGIGGGEGGAGGTVTITGGSVMASGPGQGAGIGGGFEGNGGTTSILGDARVTATGGTFAAGIGGSIGRVGGLTTIGGTANVTATGGEDAPGIGSSYTTNVSGATVISDGTPSLTTEEVQAPLSISSGAELTLTSTLPVLLDGTTTVDGTLHTSPSGLVTIPSTRTLTNNGLIDGSGQLRGEGTVDNQGIICADVDDIATSTATPATGLTVTGTAFYLPYTLPAGGTLANAVYAATLEEGCRSLPDYSTDEQIQVGWTVDADGPFLTDTSDLATLVPSGSATLEPVMVDAALTIDPAVTSSTAGDTVTVSVFGPLPLSNTLLSDLTDRATLSGDLTAGIDPGTFISTTAGDQIVAVSAAAGDRTLLGEFTHTTATAATSELAISASALTVNQGGSVTLDVTGTDEFGNPVAIDPVDVTVTSSVATDIIDGLTVTFPTASPHVLTVTVGELSAQVTVQVEPAAVIPVNPEPVDPDAGETDTGDTDTDGGESELAVTGTGPTSQPLGSAILLMVLGAGLLLGRRSLTRPRSRS